MKLADCDVVLHVEDHIEHAVLAPIGAELERRGAQVRISADLHEPATVGLYACHANRFFDSDAARWIKPPHELSVLALHDMGQGHADPAGYFHRESWHSFDLGLLPGPSWMHAYETAVANGAAGPRFGVREIGWPKADHTQTPAFRERVAELRAQLGIDPSKRVVLLACSWSQRSQVADLAQALRDRDLHIVAKYPQMSPPAADHPWRDRINAQIEEVAAAEALAAELPNVTVAPVDSDIMALCLIADVVVSNGSNVLYEGILSGTGGVCVVDWQQPTGSTGDHWAPSISELPGVINGTTTALTELIDTVLDPRWAAVIGTSADRLVAPASRGRGAILAADAIEALLAEDTPKRAPLEDLGPITSMEGVAAALAAADAREARAREQLEHSATELDAMREALLAADEREIRARAQLAEYERTISELRGGVTR